MQLTDIRRYPVKSCRGESIAEAVVEPWGLRGDRRWMVVDADGDVITARECNPMVLIRPVITETGLVLGAPDLPDLTVARPTGERLQRVGIWSSDLDAAPAGAEADAWLSKAMGRDAHLVYLDDPTRRATDPDYSEPTDRVSFADGYPLLLATQESLAALNDAVHERHQGQHEPMTMTRFRPNVVLSGAPAWAEDDWHLVRIGEATFRSVKPCDRCVLTTIDPETAARGHEPIATLARIRRRGSKTLFGVNLVPDSPGAVIRVGDEAEVLG
ncbi:MOSC domain-containing protein [Nocardioides mangrovicus]|uniref:MOSC domain-containing protein n=1 Tax=Nocardioides mangrovicus TaxID=2478913 RepID=A0A3L8P7E2_9ACTN|nr:MOSC N-terminal beta barrel domain-containing protein [Nocardioides mangrovicus]RLV50663.1 MOSC domain-containing protein [Nocardioides mangrovicus]